MDLFDALDTREPTEQAMREIQKAVSDPDTDQETCGACVEKLSDWLRRSAMFTQKMIASARLAPVIVNVMRKYTHDLEIARYGCRVMAGISNRHAENTNMLCKNGGVIVLNQVIDYHINDSQTQESATQALICLAEKSGAREIVATGGIMRMLRVVEAHPDNTYIQRSAWKAMDQLVEKSGSITAEMRKEIIEAAAMVTCAQSRVSHSSHPKDKEIKQYADKLSNWVRTMKDDDKKVKAPIAPAPKKVEKAPEKEIAPSSDIEVGLRPWLTSVDETGSLLTEYHGILSQNFDSVLHIVDAYVDGGKLDKQFFVDLGISKLGHKRKFICWFNTHLDDLVRMQVNLKA